MNSEAFTITDMHIDARTATSRILQRAIGISSARIVNTE